MYTKLTICIACVLTGCHNVTPSATHQYDYSPPEELIMEEVDATPLTFQVPFAEESYAWERVHYFFTKTLGQSKVAPSEGGINGEVYLQGGSPHFLYSLKKSPRVGGYSYTVACIDAQSKSITKASLRNAKNLARFISKGTLESKALSR